MRLAVLITTAIILVSCSLPVVVPVQIPERPELPKIKEIDFECLTTDIFVLMVKRDVLQKTYIDRLISIMKAHNE